MQRTLQLQWRAPSKIMSEQGYTVVLDVLAQSLKRSLVTLNARHDGVGLSWAAYYYNRIIAAMMHINEHD